MIPDELPPQLTDGALEIVVRRLADDLQYGLDTSVYLGPGVDYVQSRPFVDGDAVRDIDWPLTGRTGRYHVKQYESLKRMAVYLVVDTSGSMSLSSRSVTKHSLATMLAGALAVSAIRRLNPVGVVDAGSRDLHVQPSLSRTTIFHWLKALGHVTYHEPTRLAARLDQLIDYLRTRSVIVVISDLHDPAAIGAIRRTNQRHDVIVLKLEDPAERGRLRAGLIPAVEAETGRMFLAHGRTRWLDDRTTELLKDSAIDHLILSTDQDILVPLRRFFRERGGLFRNVR
ncbi:MAG: DUF58 domain-containing protein [Planctomycetia bacterium]|nr:DUF58 domain-containing protein [Planctomycetia bacterium]